MSLLQGKLKSRLKQSNADKEKIIAMRKQLDYLKHVQAVIEGVISYQSMCTD